MLILLIRRQSLHLAWILEQLFHGGLLPRMGQNPMKHHLHCGRKHRHIRMCKPGPSLEDEDEPRVMKWVAAIVHPLCYSPVGQHDRVGILLWQMARFARARCRH